MEHTAERRVSFFIILSYFPPLRNGRSWLWYVFRAAFEKIECGNRYEIGCRTLTFPWGNEDTQTLIDILGSYGVKATFFVVGDWVTKYPESVQALYEAGHEVMTHSDDHAHFSKLTADQIRRNINAGCDKIEAVTGQRPTLFRCPYGEYDDHVIETLTDMGMQTIQWDVDTLAAVGKELYALCRKQLIMRINSGQSVFLPLMRSMNTGSAPRSRIKASCRAVF